jgi:hypothetical protein
MLNSCNFSRSLMRRIAVVTSVVAFAAMPYLAKAQSNTNTDASESGHAYSSSADWKSILNADFDGEGLAAAPAPQYGGGGGGYNRYPESTNRWSHIAIVAGAGFTAPLGNTTHGGPNYPNSIGETYGYNIKAGAGWNFTKRFGTLLEYNFNRDKIPGSTLTEIVNENDLGQPLGGNVNTWSFTIEPIFYQPITKKFGGYVTGGGGFYRKVTNFTLAIAQCDFFECFGVPTTIAHSSSNQGGLNFGVGFYWKAFGEDSNTKLFSEVRYTWVDSPTSSNSDPFGSGTSSLLPVTFGIRF